MLRTSLLYFPNVLYSPLFFIYFIFSEGCLYNEAVTAREKKDGQSQFAIWENWREMISVLLLCFSTLVRSTCQLIQMNVKWREGKRVWRKTRGKAIGVSTNYNQQPPTFLLHEKLKMQSLHGLVQGERGDTCSFVPCCWYSI